MYNKNNRVDVTGGVRPVPLALLAAVAVLAGCGSLQAEDVETSAPTAAIKEIKVFFNGDCPDAVDDFVFIANKGEQIVWQSVKNDGTVDPDKPKQFKVYFDPFKGADIQSNPQGRTNVKTIDGSIPAGVLYKYTITGDDCSASDGGPLDPFIRLL